MSVRACCFWGWKERQPSGHAVFIRFRHRHNRRSTTRGSPGSQRLGSGTTIGNDDLDVSHSPIAPDLYQGAVSRRHATDDGRDLGRTVHSRTSDLQNDIPRQEPHFFGIGAWFRTKHQHPFLGRQTEAFYNGRRDRAQMRPKMSSRNGYGSGNAFGRYRGWRGRRSRNRIGGDAWLSCAATGAVSLSDHLMNHLPDFFRPRRRILVIAFLSNQ